MGKLDGDKGETGNTGGLLRARAATPETHLGPESMNLISFLKQQIQSLESGTPIGQVVSSTKERLAEIENPHRALEEEWIHFVEAKMSPNREYYKNRKDKSELAVAFFQRIYGRFHEAGLLYRHQLRAIDFPLYEALARLKDSLVIPTKSDAISKLLGTTGRPKDLMRQLERLKAAAKRR